MSQTAELVEKKSDKVPEMYIELTVKGESGYVMDGTKGTPHEQTINCAGLAFVPSVGKMAVEIVDENGKGTGRYRNEEIRYIKDCPYITVADQKKYGYEKNKIATNDAIPIKKGSAIIRREGDVALYDYLMNVFYNADAPNRPKTLPKNKAIYKVVEIEKNITKFNEDIFLQSEAIMYVKTLVLSSGKSFKYQENKIDNLITALNVFGGDNYSTKIRVLTDCAKKDPKGFLDLATKLESITITEITHALELDVIRFEGNTAEYVDGKKVLGTVPPEIKSQAKKIEALADILKTPEYAQAYTEFKAKLEIAQEKSLKA